MTFFAFALTNVRSKKARSLGLIFAIAFAVMTVVTLAVVSSGLEQSASAIITVGKADFTVAQKGASDLLTSTIDQGQLTTIAQTPGVKSAVGVLVETENLGLRKGQQVQLAFAINLGLVTKIHRRTAIVAHVTRGGTGLMMEQFAGR